MPVPGRHALSLAMMGIDARAIGGVVGRVRRMFDLGDEYAMRGYQEIIETYRDQKQWQQATSTAEEAAKRFPNDRAMQMVAASQRADLGDSA